MHRALIIGNSLFAETVAHLLVQRGEAAIAGVAASVDDALAQIPACQPDLVIVFSDAVDLHPLLTAYPDLPILSADLDANDLRIIRSQRVGSRTADLLAVIQTLPTRG